MHHAALRRRALIASAAVGGILLSSLLAVAPAQAAPDDVTGEVYPVLICGDEPFVLLDVVLEGRNGGSGFAELDFEAGSATDGGVTVDSASVTYPDRYVFDVSTPVTRPGTIGWGISSAGGGFHKSGQLQFPADCYTPFIDVPGTYQFIEPITWMAWSGIATGYDTPQGPEYRPWSSVTRDAMAAFLFRFSGQDYTPPAVSPFRDVATNNPFYREIAWLAEQGISTGWVNSDGSKDYRPYQPITRDAMAAFLDRYMYDDPAPTPEEQPFVDVAPDAPFYNEIAALADAGISTGWETANGDREFRPYAEITRDAMAAFLYRTAAVLENSQTTLGRTATPSLTRPVTATLGEGTQPLRHE
jgi:hypothetical protein